MTSHDFWLLLTYLPTHVRFCPFLRKLPILLHHFWIDLTTPAKKSMMYLKLLVFKGRHRIRIFSCLSFALFEKSEILIEKRNPDVLHQIAKSRNPG
jgi:hypothetical protein